MRLDFFRELDVWEIRCFYERLDVFYEIRCFYERLDVFMRD